MQEPGDDMTGDSVDTFPSSLTSLLLEPGEVRIQLGHCTVGEIRVFCLIGVLGVFI